MQVKTFVEIVGWGGAALILGAYALISSGRVQARSALYQWMNIVGAAGLLINGGWNGAFPSMGLNVVWLIIGLYGLARGRKSAVTTA
jgi:hypothetical protein